MAIDIHKIFADALLKLCETTPLKAITIQSLLEETGVSRQAFYNRFLDKNDLIQWVYEHNILCEFLNNGLESTYYLNTLSFYKTLYRYRNFMRQACALDGQNNLREFIFNFAYQYDLKWHQYYYGEEPLPSEFVYLTWYHAHASIATLMVWLESDIPESPETMAARITKARSVSMSDALFGPGNNLYKIE